LEKRFKRVSAYEAQLSARGARRIRLFDVDSAKWKYKRERRANKHVQLSSSG
jgi:hypothetical protein